LLKIKYCSKQAVKSALKSAIKQCQSHLQIPDSALPFFIFEGEVSNVGYSPKEQPILILHKNGKTSVLKKTSKLLNIKALSKEDKRFYICSPKTLL
jgi:hypothetical protein